MDIHVGIHLACLVAVVVADSYKTPIPILKDDRTQNAYGEYTFDFETGNGIVRNEAGKQADGQESSGGWSYTAPEGIPIKLSFTSGVGGYQPVGDHLPVAPTSVPLPYERSRPASPSTSTQLREYWLLAGVRVKGQATLPRPLDVDCISILCYGNCHG
ncbi:flexible cuticle protein 12-like [Penaeus indicus]|uniref:flexible cuticle protein 12-like n=1 Tax=Penaeus indicus TaxID=29960 RepID=UPI00300CC73A